MMAHINIQNKAIDDISFSGLLVQDMAFCDDLVKPMNKKDFDGYFSQITDNYGQLQQLSEEAYCDVYTKAFKREHKKERINMRLNLLKKVIDLRHQHKTQLIKNVKNYILKQE